MRSWFVFLASLAIAMLLGCAGGFNLWHVGYDIGLEQVERPTDAKQRYGEAVISRADTVGASKYVFSDSLITIGWVLNGESILFDLQNKSSHSIKIVWDEAAFVDPSGQSIRVMHSGVKYIDRNSSQPPTVIVHGGRITDVIQPTDYVYYTPGTYGGWHERAIFEPHSSYDIDKLSTATQNLGKTIQVLLPLEVEGIVNEYIFTFKVNNVRVPHAQPRP